MILPDMILSSLPASPSSIRQSMADEPVTEWSPDLVMLPLLLGSLFFSGALFVRLCWLFASSPARDHGLAIWPPVAFPEKRPCQVSEIHAQTVQSRSLSSILPSRFLNERCKFAGFALQEVDKDFRQAVAKLVGFS